MITGWRGIILFTGLSKEYLTRGMAYYGFPKPCTRTTRQGRAKVWSKEEVLTWLTLNNVSNMQNFERSTQWNLPTDPILAPAI